jgi:hypothetical protein
MRPEVLTDGLLQTTTDADIPVASPGTDSSQNDAGN